MSRGRGGGVQGGEEVKFSGLRYLSLSLLGLGAEVGWDRGGFNRLWFRMLYKLQFFRDISDGRTHCRCFFSLSLL